MKKKILLLILVAVLPRIVLAQFSSRFHNLNPETKTSLNDKLKQSITSLLTQKGIEFNAISGVIDTIDAILLTSSYQDSLIAEYLKIVNKKPTDTIGALSAGDYRNIIDDKIIKRRAYEHAFGKKITNGITLEAYFSDTLLFHLSPSEIQDTIKKTLITLNSFEHETPLLRGAREYFDFLNRSESNPIKKPWVLPLKSISHAEYLYFGKDGNRIKLLSNIGVQSNFTTNATVNSEIISGILPFEMRFHGNPKHKLALPLKFDLGITVNESTTDTTKTNKDVSSLLYGGLLHARLSYPFIYSNWKYHNGKGIRTYIPLTVTFNWDSKAGENNRLSELYHFTEIATNIYLDIDVIQSTNAKSDATIFFNNKMAFIDGSSKFYDMNTYDRKGLFIWQINGGFRLKDRFSIAVNIPAWSSDDKIFNDNRYILQLLS